jgi:hypothetical protein
MLLGFCVLVSCTDSKLRKRFNLDYVAPDEFMVQKQKDLILPQKFTLPAPLSKTQENESVNERQGAFSESEKALLDK